MRTRLAAVSATLVALASVATPAAAGGSNPAVDALNQLRADAGMPAVQHADVVGTDELADHLADIDELTHTPDPDQVSNAAVRAGSRSVLHGASRSGADVGRLVTELVAAPFHRFELMHPALRAVSVGTGHDTTGTIRTTVAIDTRTHRRDSSTRDAWAWPAHGQTVTDGSWDGREWPPPSSHCDADGPVGTAITLVRHDDRPVEHVTVTAAGRPVDVCVMTSDQYEHDDEHTADRATGLMAAYGAVVVLPSTPLPDGPVDVAVTDDTLTYRWGFTVGTSRGRPAGRVPIAPAGATGDLPSTADDVTIGDHPNTAARRLLVCRDDVPVDCLAAAGMARPGDRLLLVGRDHLDARDRHAAERWSAADTRLVVLGGPAAVTDQVVDDLEDTTGLRATRWWGNDRFGTAAALVSAYRPATVVVTRSDLPVDALTSGRAGMVLLADGDGLPQATVDALTVAAPDRVLVAGGPQAVPDTVVAQLQQLHGNVRRVAGPTRQATATAMAELTEAPGQVTADLHTAPWQQVLPLSVLAASYDADVVDGARLSVRGR